ncbi:MAG: trehalase-like domain-containing protein [Trueperaceae bacterium]
MAYQAIEDHGVIGDMHTVALVDTSGTIDWCCLPRFDSGSVFGAILDDRKGGRFEIHSLAERNTTKQFYWPGTNILITGADSWRAAIIRGAGVKPYTVPPSP